MSKSTLRWLLRVLCDPEFLRLYVDAATKAKGTEPPAAGELTITEIEHLFWTLPVDSEHSKQAREEAWSELQTLLPERFCAPYLFQRLFQHLDKLIRVHELRRIPSFYGLTFLFQPAVNLEIEDTRKILKNPDKKFGFVETHAHFRGSVPIDTIWRNLMDNARLRAQHRGDRIEVGAWKKTRAELLAHAHEYWQKHSPKEEPSQESPSGSADSVKPTGSAGPTDPGNPANTGSTKEDSSHERPKHLIDTLLTKLRQSTLLTTCSLASADDIAYLAIRANFGRYLSVQRGQVGLTSFTKAYDRYSSAAKHRKRTFSARARARDDIEQVAAALDEFRDRGVRSVELRPTFENTRIELQKKLRPLVLGYFRHVQRSGKAKKNPVDFGLVLSLYKQEIASTRANCAYFGAHIDGSTHSQWAKEQSTHWKRQIQGLLDVMHTVPVLRLFIVGIDAAGREQGCPVRNLGPAFELVHEYHRRHGLIDNTPGRRIIRRWSAQLRELLGDRPDDLRARETWNELCERSPWQIPPCRLGLTMHVGEDFCDPITGLREIWDAIEHLGLRRGDRLGHALAAGLQRKQLYRLFDRRAKGSSSFVKQIPGRANTYRVTKPLGVHLLDEAWQFQHLPRDLFNCPGDLLLAAGRTTSIPAEAQALSHHLRHATPATLPISGLHFYELERMPADLRTQVTIDEHYYRRFEVLRQLVLRRIRQVGLFVESCPTSNIIVAGLRTVPLTTFLQEIPDNVTLASDDPAIFNAWPDDEMQNHVSTDNMGLLVGNSIRATFL